MAKNDTSHTHWKWGNITIRPYMEDKMSQCLTQCFDLHSPFCFFSINKRDQRAVGACSSGWPRLRLQALPADSCVSHLAWIILGSLFILFFCKAATSTYFWKRFQEWSQCKHGNHDNQHHAQTGKLWEDIEMGKWITKCLQILLFLSKWLFVMTVPMIIHIYI